MAFDPITAAIVNAVVSSAIQQLASLPAPATPATMQAIGVPRMLPSEAKRGELVVSSPIAGQIDGKDVILSPAIQIRDPFNMRVLPGMIRRPVLVRYLTDPAGIVTRAWILSAQEAAQP